MTTFALILASAALTAAPRGVVLDFTATWCGPCQQMSPIVSKLERQGYPIYKIDVDQQRALARKYNISSIPAFVLIIDGEEVDRVVGMTTESTLKRMLARIPDPEPDPQPAVIAQEQEPAGRAVPLAAVDPPRDEPAAPPEQPKRSFFQFPSFGGRNTSAERDQAAAPVIRANQFDNENEFAGELVEDPLASTVRIRIKDEKGVNFGSGTMIDSRPGNTVILTCGHIFKDLKETSLIEVDVFERGQYRTFAGKALAYDLEADVGLIVVPTDGTLPTSPVIAEGGEVVNGQQVFSIGCDGGEPPTRQELQVTALNRYLGPDNIECTGIPVQGRSGGGLFTADGEVVGVCVAADTKESRGLYAGVKAIHSLLERARLARLFRTGDSGGTSLAAVESRDEAGLSALASGLAATAENTPAGVAAALEDAEEAEVICIIRPLKNPQSASRVVIINRASPKFVSYLAGELSQQPKQTSREVNWTDMNGPDGREMGSSSGPSSSTSNRFAGEPPRNDESLQTERPQRYRRSPDSR